jgi:outer membrane protein assembly factor BamD
MRKTLSYAALVLLLTAILLSGGCSKRRLTKLARSRLIADRDSAAFRYYRKGALETAAGLFEDLMSAYRSTPRHEVIMYTYATCRMKQKQYLTSATYFQQFVEQYPNSIWTEEALYNVGYSYFLGANVYELDQGDTKKALDGFQLFATVYTSSPRLPEVNAKVRELRDRLAHKGFNQAVLYLNIGHYKSAITSFKNVLTTYGDSKYREEAQFKLLESAVTYADFSIEQRQPQRYLDALIYYNRYIEKYPAGAFIRDAERLYERLDRQLKKIEVTKGLDREQLKELTQ